MAQPRRVGELLPGYIKADARNLPRVDIFMVVEYYRHQVHPAMKHVKLQRSAGEEYGDDAVAYVQIKRTGSQCEVQARITPEHKVNAKPYRVVAVIDEEKAEVAEVRCEDCAASAGGCKHAAAFLGWLERRSADKAVTSVASYWKKARLSSVSADVKTATAGQLRKRARRGSGGVLGTRGDSFFNSVLNYPAPEKCGVLFDHFGDRELQLEDMGIDRLLTSYLAGCAEGADSCDGFLDYCRGRMTPALCAAVREATKGQGKCPLWHAVRFGRITASKAHGVAHCQKNNGSLALGILGAAKVKDTAAMARGRMLEPLVIREVEKHLGEKIASSGILISGEHPAFGASPDGVTASGSIVEVKCPSSDKTLRRYINSNGSVAQKHVAQVQLLMLMAQCKMAYFCVADPSFETNRQVTIVSVDYDEMYCRGLLSRGEAFWRAAVYGELRRARAQ